MSAITSRRKASSPTRSRTSSRLSTPTSTARITCSRRSRAARLGAASTSPARARCSARWQSRRKACADPRLYRSFEAYHEAGCAHGGLCKTYLQLSGRLGALEYLEQPRAAAPKCEALQTFIEQKP